MTSRMSSFAFPLLWVATLVFCGGSAAEVLTSMSYLVDATGTQDIGRVAQGAAGPFQPLPGDTVHLGFSKDDHWFRIAIDRGQESGGYVLALTNPRLGQVTLYTPGPDGFYSEHHAGVRVPFWSRSVNSLSPAFPLGIGAGQESVLYLRVRNSGSMRFGLVLEPTDQFSRRASYALALALAIGITLLVIACYNLTVYLHLRQAGYLWIALFLLVCALRQTTAAATANMFLWPDAPLWARHAMTMTGLATLATGAAMAHNLLRIATNSPRWARFNALVVALALLGGLLSLGGIAASFYLMLAGGLLLPISITVFAIRAISKGSPGARWFLLSWGLVLPGAITTNLVGPGFVPANLLTEHLLDLGLLAAGLCWSFTLTSQIKERQEVEQQRLEAKVRERTAALEEALTTARTLRGLLPICSCCKKIRNDRGFWEQVETYLGEHTEADFSHGLCPSCAQANYPAYFPPGGTEPRPDPPTG